MTNHITKKRPLPDDLKDDSWADRIHRIRCELSDTEQPIAMTDLARRLGVRFGTIQNWEAGIIESPKPAYLTLVNTYVRSVGKGHLVHI